MCEAAAELNLYFRQAGGYGFKKTKTHNNLNY